MSTSSVIRPISITCPIAHREIKQFSAEVRTDTPSILGLFMLSERCALLKLIDLPGWISEQALALTLVSVTCGASPAPFSSRQHLSLWWLSGGKNLMGRLSDLLCVVLCTEVVHSRHTWMSSSYYFWAHFTVCRFSYKCLCLYHFNTVAWTCGGIGLNPI